MGKNKEKAARENKKKSVVSSEFIHKVRQKYLHTYVKFERLDEMQYISEKKHDSAVRN